MLKKNSQLSVVVLLYNSENYLAGCLSSLKRQSYSDIEIIIIDNASAKDPANKISEIMGEYRYTYYRNKNNIGYAAGNNIGIEKASGDYVLLLNPDVILEKDYISRGIDFFDKNNEAGSITGNIFKYRLLNGQIERTNMIDTRGLHFLKTHRVIEIDAGKKAGKELNNKNREIFGASAAAGIYRKKALDEIKNISFNNNYFDDNFFIYKEDIDLAFRLRHAGWKSYCVDDMKAYHDRWETGSSNKSLKIIQDRKKKSDRVNYYSYRNHLLLIFKNQFLVNLLIYLPLILIYEIKKFTYFLLFEQKTLLGLFSFIRLIPLTWRKRNAILSKSRLKPSELRRWF